jgi:predicted ATPase
LDPHRETAHRALMRLYVRQGRRAQALHQYQRLIELLRRDLGAEPEPETRRLYQALIRKPLALISGQPRPEEEGRDSGRVDPPLVGRDAELLKLTALADTAYLGRGRAVALLAESGGGKSRMLQELVTRWLAGGGSVLRGRCHEIQQTVPLALWSATLAEVAAGDLDRILGAGSLARRLVATLLTEPSALLIDPEAATQGNRAVLFDALTEVLAQLAAKRPLAVILDDLQWADHRSLELLGHVAHRLARAPVLLALAARDEELVDRPRLDALLLELARDGLLDRLPLRLLAITLHDWFLVSPPSALRRPSSNAQRHWPGA